MADCADLLLIGSPVSLLQQSFSPAARIMPPTPKFLYLETLVEQKISVQAAMEGARLPETVPKPPEETAVTYAFSTDPGLREQVQHRPPPLPTHVPPPRPPESRSTSRGKQGPNDQPAELEGLSRGLNDFKVGNSNTL